MKIVASFSGGKDSTAMVLEMLERGEQLDEVVFFNTGWEFPQMIKHVDKFERYIGMPIIRLKPKQSFNYLMLEHEVVGRKGVNKGKIYRVGYGWPSPMRRWCTDRKVSTIKAYLGNKTDIVQSIGYASDEYHRSNRTEMQKKKYSVRFPLIEYGITEKQALEICKSHGFDWGGLYDIFSRVSCFCCPLQRIGEQRNLRHHFPDLWEQMLDWDSQIGAHNRGFRDYDTVHDLENRFALEDCQQRLFKKEVV